MSDTVKQQQEEIITKIDNKIKDMKDWKYHPNAHTLLEQLAELRQKCDILWGFIEDLENVREVSQSTERWTLNYNPPDRVQNRPLWSDTTPLVSWTTAPGVVPPGTSLSEIGSISPEVMAQLLRTDR